KGCLPQGSGAPRPSTKWHVHGWPRNWGTRRIGPISDRNILLRCQRSVVRRRYLHPKPGGPTLLDTSKVRVSLAGRTRTMLDKIPEDTLWPQSLMGRLWTSPDG